MIGAHIEAPIVWLTILEANLLLWEGVVILLIGEILYKELWPKYGFLAWFKMFFHRRSTPWKINMEPTNHPFIKENDLPNLHDYVPC